MIALHLTDAHIGQKTSRAYEGVVRKEFRDDLKYLLSSGRAIDLVLFSGDLANTGDYAEFTRVTEFLDEVFSDLGQDIAGVDFIAVPGNHDADRPEPTGAVAMLLERDRPAVVRELESAYASGLANEYREVVEAAFMPYTAWQKSTSLFPPQWRAGLLPGDGVARFESDGLSLAVIAVNTATLHLTETVQEGELSLLESQVDEVVRLALEEPLADLHILMTHHPPAWLDDRSRELLNDDLGGAVPISLHLFGHRHKSEFTSLNSGTDPRATHSLQGRSFFGQRYLSDGETERLHGYSLLEFDGREQTMRVAPRRADGRPVGGMVFAPERSKAWYLPKGDEWSRPVTLRQSTEAEPPPVSPPLPPESTDVVSDSSLIEEVAEEIAAGMSSASLRYWAPRADPATATQNLRALFRMLPSLDPLSALEGVYVCTLVLLSRMCVDIALEFGSVEAFLEDPDWAHEAADITTSHERLVSRATDPASDSLTRSTLGEWLLRRALARSPKVWSTPSLRVVADRVAAILEKRPAHVASLADRLLADAMAVRGAALPTERLEENWALGVDGGNDLSHMRGAEILPLAAALVALEFDSIADGAELVEQVGVVSEFSLENLRNDIAGAEWVVTEDGSLALIAQCFDPAVEVALERFVERVKRIGGQLRMSAAGTAVSDVLERRLSTEVVPRRDNGTPVYSTPVTRLVMDSERIRSLLMGEQLYGQPRLAIRELYQNALDACRYRALRHEYLSRTAALSAADWDGRIEFRAPYDADGNVPVLECEDNGVGMNAETLSSCFLSAGTRFVETVDFADEQANWLATDDDDLRLYPNSTFGIGAYSYFMLADVVEVFSRPQDASGSLADGVRLQINAGSSVARISGWEGWRTELPQGGTIVKLHLRPEFRGTSRLQLGNFFDEVILRSPFEVTTEEGHERRTRDADEFSPEVASPRVPAWSNGLSSAWWRTGHGNLLADGIKTPVEAVGLMVNLHGDKKPVLRVDRNAVVRWEMDWVLDNTAASAEALVGWDSLSLNWLWNFSEHYPVHGQRLYEAVRELRPLIPLGQSEMWQAEIDLRKVGCFPGDRYLLSELHDSRWRSEYEEIEIPAVTQQSDRYGGLTVRFPSCLRPWRRRVWLDALPELFEGWAPRPEAVLMGAAETMRGGREDLVPVWEPDALEGLPPPDPIDAAFLASQPNIIDVPSWIGMDAGHAALVDVVALVHASHRCDIPLEAAVQRLARYVRFGLRGVPTASRAALDYVPTLLDCRLVAALGRSWSATREITREDLLALIPLCHEHGLTVGEALDAARSLFKRLGMTVASPGGMRDVYERHVPSAREVRFLGFDEYDHGRELRFGRGTRGALIRAAFRADMRQDEVATIVERYAGFGLRKYRRVLKAVRFRPQDKASLRAWSTNFDSRAPWIDEDVFRRGFISDSPSTTDELHGHAVFYAVMAEISLRESVELVMSFPGLSDEQRGGAENVPDVSADQRDLEMLRDRIGRTSQSADKRFSGIGQQQLVRRAWSVLELKAAARGTDATMTEVFERLGKFEFLGVVLPECGPEAIEEYEFNELEQALLTTKDTSLGAFGRFHSPWEEDRKPIIGPIPTRHLMAVACEEKVGLGSVSDALVALAELGVQTSAAPVPDALGDFVPTATDVSLAGRIDRTTLGYAILEHAFNVDNTVGYVCDLLSPWLRWLTGAGETIDERIDRVREDAGNLKPSYSQLSFFAAAEAQAHRHGNTLVPAGACALGAQGNTSFGQVADLAAELEPLFMLDDLGVDLEMLADGNHRGIVPDSTWVLAIDPAALVGRSVGRMRREFGLTAALASKISTALGAEPIST